MRSRFWGPVRQDWYSLCSAHMEHDETCDLCKTGLWHSRINMAVSSFVGRHAYWLWYWWHNRQNSRTRRFLKSHFPNLR